MTTAILFSILALIPILFLIASFYEETFGILFIITGAIWIALSLFSVEEKYTEYQKIDVTCQMAHCTLYVKAGDNIYTFEKLKDIEKYKDLKYGYLKIEKNMWNSVTYVKFITEKPENE